MAKPTATTTKTTTTNPELDFKVDEFVFAQAQALTKGEWYAHYPAVIKKHFNKTTVICEWIDPEGRWGDPLQLIQKKRLLNWNYENINNVHKQVPPDDDAYWGECTRVANRRILGKICFSRSKAQRHFVMLKYDVYIDNNNALNT